MNFSKIGRYLLIPFAVFVCFVPIFDPLNVFSSLRNSAFDLFQNICVSIKKEFFWWRIYKSKLSKDDFLKREHMFYTIVFVKKQFWIKGRFSYKIIDHNVKTIFRFEKACFVKKISSFFDTVPRFLYQNRYSLQKQMFIV